MTTYTLDLLAELRDFVAVLLAQREGTTVSDIMRVGMLRFSEQVGQDLCIAVKLCAPYQDQILENWMSSGSSVHDPDLAR